VGPTHVKGGRQDRPETQKTGEKRISTWVVMAGFCGVLAAGRHSKIWGWGVGGLGGEGAVKGRGTTEQKRFDSKKGNNVKKRIQEEGLFIIPSGGERGRTVCFSWGSRGV